MARTRQAPSTRSARSRYQHQDDPKNLVQHIEDLLLARTLDRPLALYRTLWQSLETGLDTSDINNKYPRNGDNVHSHLLAACILRLPKKAQVHAKIMSKGETWNLDVLDVYAIFGDGVYNSTTGLHALRVLAQHKAVGFPAAIAEIRRWASIRQRGELGHSRLDRKATFTPWDIQRAIENVCEGQGGEHCQLCTSSFTRWAPGRRKKHGGDEEENHGQHQDATDHGQGTDGPDLGQSRDAPDLGHGEDAPDLGHGGDAPDLGHGGDAPDLGHGEAAPDLEHNEDAPIHGQDDGGAEDIEEFEEPIEKGRPAQDLPKDCDAPTSSPVRFDFDDGDSDNDDPLFNGYGLDLNCISTPSPDANPNPNPSRFRRQASSAFFPSSLASLPHHNHYRPPCTIRSTMDDHRTGNKRPRRDVEPADTDAPTVDVRAILAAFLPDSTRAPHGFIGRNHDGTFIYILNPTTPSSSNPTEPTDSWALLVRRPETAEPVVYATTVAFAEAAFDCVQMEWPTDFPRRDFTSTLFEDVLSVEHSQSSQIVACVLGILIVFDAKIPPFPLSLSLDLWATLFSMYTTSSKRSSLADLLDLLVHTSGPGTGLHTTAAYRDCDFHSRKLKMLGGCYENSRLCYLVASASLKILENSNETNVTDHVRTREDLAQSEERVDRLKARQRTADKLSEFRSLLADMLLNETEECLRKRLRQQLEKSKESVRAECKKLLEEVEKF